MSAGEYDKKVLIGNWVEERVECQPYRKIVEKIEKKRGIQHVSEVPESRRNDFRLNKVNDTTGHLPVILRHDNQGPCRDNKTTTTDLVYNHLPKPLCGPAMRKYRNMIHQFSPQPDMVKCMGNLTEWGLRKYKQWEWDCGKGSDYISSTFQDSFLPPSANDYVTDRKFIDSSFTKTFKSLISK